MSVQCGKSENSLYVVHKIKKKLTPTITWTKDGGELGKAGYLDGTKVNHHFFFYEVYNKEEWIFSCMNCLSSFLPLIAQNNY